MKSVSFFSSWKILLVITLGSLHMVLNGQNPLEIKSRLSSPTTVQTQPNSSSILPNNTLSNGAVNPLDIKKEPIRHKTKPISAKEIKRNVNEVDSQLSKPLKIVILLASIIFFVIIRNINLKGFQQITQSFISNIKLTEYKNSINGVLNPQLSLYYLFFFANVSYFLYLCFEKNFFDVPIIIGGRFISLLIILMGIYLIKYLVLFTIQYALSIRRAISNHLFSVSIHNILLGFALFFINTFYAFSSGKMNMIFMFIGLGLIGLMYVIRQVKGLQYLSDLRHFSIFHFFIYLCSCEISPLLIVAKMVTG